MAAPLRYKAALAAILVAFPGLAAPALTVAGAILPDEARKIGENRYQVDRSWDDVQKFFRQTYSAGKFPRRPIADLPGVKAVHIANPEAKPGQWEGMNVYELKGEVRVFVLVKR